MPVNAAMARRASPGRGPLPSQKLPSQKLPPRELPSRNPQPLPRKPAPRASGRTNTILFSLGAVSLSLVAAAFMTSPGLFALTSSVSESSDRPTFEDRFISAPKTASSALLQPLKRLVLAKADLDLSTTREALASRWPDNNMRPENNLRPAIADVAPVAPASVGSIPPVTSVAVAVPLPRSRPAAANQTIQTSFALASASAPTQTVVDETLPHPAERSALQKFSDMMKSKMAVASLGMGKGPDLAALGYDSQTAVYDISGHAVYLPNGTVMEAHSGMGAFRDDVNHVLTPMTGATPPAMYSLKPREAMFHGVAALRMTPAEGSDIGGRSGLLVHSFMLGPGGDSNGCISVKDFDRFRKAYDEGQFNHIAVVPSVKAIILAQQNTD